MGVGDHKRDSREPLYESALQHPSIHNILRDAAGRLYASVPDHKKKPASQDLFQDGDHPD